jgi:hypothetical protein
MNMQLRGLYPSALCVFRVMVVDYLGLMYVFALYEGVLLFKVTIIYVG